MTTPPPKRSWWRRKRTWAALLLWLSVSYPLGLGPLSYAYHRDWLSATAFSRAYAPVLWLSDYVDVYGPDRYGSDHPVLVFMSRRLDEFCAYRGWWDELGKRHAAPD